ncbi:hypothetical protein LCGC14_1264660 [marine sediment metagenome]|uniref:Uncharacterized protein n=1 Tax=marine sediment metagenome TaxID=412755 RepID=A0A0F9DIL6_9ZZZZ
MRIWINNSIENIHLSKEVSNRKGRKVRKLTIFFENEDRITLFLTQEDLEIFKELLRAETETNL